MWLLLCVPPGTLVQLLLFPTPTPQLLSHGCCLLSLAKCQIHVACRLETARADILSLQSPVFSNAQLLVLSSQLPRQWRLQELRSTQQQHSSGHTGTEPGNTDLPLAQRN